MLLDLPTLPTWDRSMHSISTMHQMYITVTPPPLPISTMHSISTMHQSVKHSLRHREALKQCVTV